MTNNEAEQIMILVSALVHVARENEKKWPLGIGMPADRQEKEMQAWLAVQEFVDLHTED